MDISPQLLLEMKKVKWPCDTRKRFSELWVYLSSLEWVEPPLGPTNKKKKMEAKAYSFASFPEIPTDDWT